MKVAFATCSAMPDGWVDDHFSAGLLGADFRQWDDDTVDWNAYDRVVLRSVWDYSGRVEEFLAWCRDVGPGRLRNPPALVAFNADKRPKRPVSRAPAEMLGSSGRVALLQPYLSAIVERRNVVAGSDESRRH